MSYKITNHCGRDRRLRRELLHLPEVEEGALPCGLFTDAACLSSDDCNASNRKSRVPLAAETFALAQAERRRARLRLRAGAKVRVLNHSNRQARETR